VIPRAGAWKRTLGQFAILILLAGCSEDAEVSTPVVRPVRIATVEQAPTRAVVSMTGRIEAEDQAAIGFRIAGRLLLRPAAVGDTVQDGQVLAELEPQDEQNALRSARVDLNAARGRLTQAQNHYDRQAHLLARNLVSRADFEAAQQARIAARAGVEAAEAQLRTAEDRLGFTVLRADVPSTVTAVGAEPGEFVSAGQMVVRLARRDGRDAVFDIPVTLLDTVLPGALLTVRLATDSTAIVSGRVREVAPQADIVTRTFRVRVGLKDPPAAFRLGSSVIGSLKEDISGLLQVPTTAIVGSGDSASVWLVDPVTSKVSLRKIKIERSEPEITFVSTGLQAGDIVVSAGTNQLSEGQAVRVPGGES
jgi:RND family efflux transporter MFP subunit